MTTLHEDAQDVSLQKFQNDSLSFEELQELEKIKKDMLKGNYYSFNEIFHAV